MSAKLLPQKKVFPPPTLPCTFRPFHRFHKTAEQLAQDAVGDTFSGKKLRDSHKQTAVDRGLLLGETPLACRYLCFIFSRLGECTFVCTHMNT